LQQFDKNKERGILQVKQLRRLSKNKKGVSSLFIAIYVLLLASILISTLFISLNLGKSSLSTSMKVEEERIQEDIIIGGPGGMQLDGINVDSLRINNTGSIAVRIRALYIDDVFQCDPSTFEGDAYIKPKDYLWIQLAGNTEVINYEQNKNSFWTVTTERGTQSTERGDHILEGPTAPVQDTSNIRVGPFEIAFEEFYWSKNSPISWKPGWSIPDGTKDVIFKITIKNMDNEPIILNNRCCFTLVGNDNIPNNRLFWYIRPPQSGNLILNPGDTSEIIYDRAAPGSKTVPNFDKFQVGATCINYLIFTGYYAYSNGSPNLSKPLAQTIPFEAVLST